MSPAHPHPMIRPLRICLVGTHARNPERYPSASQTLALGLQARGHAIHLSSTRRGQLTRLADIYRTLRRGSRRFDVVLIDTYSTRALWYARLASRLASRAGLPAVAVLHGGDLPRVAKTRPAMLRAHLTRVTRVTAPSPYLAREVGEVLGIPVEVIPNPIPLHAYNGQVRSSVAPRLLWARAFAAAYRPEDAVRLVHRLAGEQPGVSLVMAGPDKDGSLGRCQTLARELGVADRIQFPGLVDKQSLRELGEAADIFLNTTGVDNTPVSLLEALALGLCIVSTDVGGIPDLLEHDRTALLVPPGDLDAAAHAVRHILQDPSIATRLSTNALHAAQAFDPERILDRWERLLCDLSPGND